MPKSRTDKSRKQKLLKYKKSKKMSKAPEMKPFRQFPEWDSKAKFEIQGDELEAFYNFFNIFAPAYQATQQIFSRGMAAGTIKMKYEYEDGKPVPQDEIEDYTKKLTEYFKQKAIDESKPFSEAPQPDGTEVKEETPVLPIEAE